MRQFALFQMIRVLFICHGNICRSPMAEFLFKDYVEKKGKKDLFKIDSMATSSEEIGNSIHRGTRMILNKYNIKYDNHIAKRVSINDYNNYDFIIAMDNNNIYNLRRIFTNMDKVHLLLEYSNLDRDISDPWYTGDFDTTYDDIMMGIEGFYNYLVENNYI